MQYYKNYMLYTGKVIEVVKNKEVGTKARHCKGIGLRTTHVYGLADSVGQGVPSHHYILSFLFLVDHRPLGPCKFTLSQGVEGGSEELGPESFWGRPAFWTAEFI